MNCVYFTSYSCIIHGNKLCIGDVSGITTHGLMLLYYTLSPIWRMDHSRPVAGGEAPISQVIRV